MTTLESTEVVVTNTDNIVDITLAQVLAQILENKTGTQDLLKVSTPARDIFGNRLVGYKAIIAFDMQAGRLWCEISRRPEIWELYKAMSDGHKPMKRAKIRLQIEMTVSQYLASRGRKILLV